MLYPRHICRVRFGLFNGDAYASRSTCARYFKVSVLRPFPAISCGSVLCTLALFLTPDPLDSNCRSSIASGLHPDIRICIRRSSTRRLYRRRSTSRRYSAEFSSSISRNFMRGHHFSAQKLAYLRFFLYLCAIIRADTK